MGRRHSQGAWTQPRLAIGLLAATFLGGLIYFLGPWSQAGPERIEVTVPEARDSGARSAVDASRAGGVGPGIGVEGESASAVDHETVDGQRSEIEGTWILGRLRFPVGVAVPEGTRVCAVESSRAGSVGARERLAGRVRQGEQGFAQVPDDGRFRIALAGPEPFARKWVIYAGAEGWTGSVVFPDPRPLAPGPEDEFEIWMNPIFGASIELVTPTGARPKLNRALLRESGGPGLYVSGRWSVHGPLAVDSAAALLSVPAGLPPLVGGQDPSIGLQGMELAIQVGTSENWTMGEFQHWFNVEFPGYEPIKEVLRFGPLAKGDLPHYRFVLRPRGGLGELRLRFDRAAWWNRELEAHGASRLKLIARRLDAPDGRAVRELEMSLERIPESGELLLEEFPSGHYRLELIARYSGVPVPILPAEVQVPEAGVAEAVADCGAFGAIELTIAEDCEGEWSTGRLEFLALDEGNMRSFRVEEWPVFLGPLPSTADGVVLVRSLDRKTPPQLADRLNHDDEFPIIAGTTTNYAIVGLR